MSGMKGMMKVAPFFILGGVITVWYGASKGGLGSTVQTKVQAFNKKIGVSS